MGRVNRSRRWAFLQLLMKRLSILFLLFPIVTSAAAESLSFDAAARLAAANNPDLHNAEAQVRAAEFRARGAGSGFRPQISGSLGYSDSSGSTSDDAGRHSAGVTATQNLFAGFADEARVEQSTAQLASAQAALATAKARLSRDLKAAYAGLLYAQENIVLTESILRRLEENFRLVELRFEGGRENKGSYLLTRAAVAQARLERLQAQQALAAARAELARVLGEPVAQWQAAGSVSVSVPEPGPDFAALARATPDVRGALAGQAVAEAGIRLARSGYYPSVNVSGTVGRDGDQWFPGDSRNSVLATVSIPIYSGGSDYYGVREAAASLDAAKASRESVEQQLLVRLRQNHAAFVEAVERVNVDRAFLEAAETRASIARARYQNGLISFEDWDRIESELIQRQKAWLATQRDRVNSEAAWEQVQGKGVIP